MIRPAAYFFVRSEQQLHRRVRHLRMLHQIRRRSHDLRHPSLIVRPQQRRPVRGNDRVPFHFFQRPKSLWTYDDIALRQDNITSVVVVV